MSKSRSQEDAVQWYLKNRPIYKKLSAKIESIIREILDIKEISIHAINSRAKEIGSFEKKAGNNKYKDPTLEITDLAGVRIITYVEDDVKSVSGIIKETFDIDNKNSLDKSTELGIDKVGYKSVHFVAKLKKDRLSLPEYSLFQDRFFEVQIRTILQHAWAEIEHDRNYKFTGKLPDEIQRRFSVLSGTLELADREFNSIANEIDNLNREIDEGTKKGELDFVINSTSLKQYLESKFSNLELKNLEIDSNLIEEINKFGIHKLQELDKLVPKDFEESLKKLKSERNNNPYAIVRLILIIAEPIKYFEKSWDGWKVWSTYSKDDSKSIFDHYKIDWENIKDKFGVSLN